MLQRACFLLFAFALTAAAQGPKPQYPPTHWPIEKGSFDIRDFRFGTGVALLSAREKLPTSSRNARDGVASTKLQFPSSCSGRPHFGRASVCPLIASCRNNHECPLLC